MTRGIPVPAEQRPIKYRQGSRVIVRCGERIFLMRDSDPGVPGSDWLVTPGGGVDAGESWPDAAVRELYEETGIRVSATDLVGPIATQIIRHGYCDRVLVQQEMFFLLDVATEFEPITDGFTEEERQTVTGWAWIALSDIPQLKVWPNWIPELVTNSGSGIRDYGVREESTVPVLPGQGEDFPAEWSVS